MNPVFKAALDTALADGVTDLKVVMQYVRRWYDGIEDEMPGTWEIIWAAQRYKII